MRKSQSIDTEAVLAKTREILEAEKAAQDFKANYPNRHQPTNWEGAVAEVDKGLLLEAKVDQLKHEYAVLLTGARPRKPKAKKATKTKRVTATDYLDEPAPYDRGREES